MKFRLQLLKRHLRPRRVLEIAAEKGPWGNPLKKGQGRGIAQHFSFGSYVAQVAEVSVNEKGLIVMGRYGKESPMEPAEVLRRAEGFFGDGGLGLKLVERTECCLSFEGGGGHVVVSVARCEPNYTTVDLETREWDYHVKKFMGKV